MKFEIGMRFVLAREQNSVYKIVDLGYRNGLPVVAVCVREDKLLNYELNYQWMQMEYAANRLYIQQSPKVELHQPKIYPGYQFIYAGMAYRVNEINGYDGKDMHETNEIVAIALEGGSIQFRASYLDFIQLIQRRMIAPGENKTVALEIKGHHFEMNFDDLQKLSRDFENAIKTLKS